MKNTNTSKVEYKGIRILRLAENLEYVRSHSVIVGLLEPGEAADAAIANEFGLGIPERSFFRSTINEQRETLRKMLNDVVKAASDPDTKIEELSSAIRQIGAFLSSEIKKRMGDGHGYTPLAESTKQRKMKSITNAKKLEKFSAGEGSPLIDTGQMRSSIKHKLIDDDAELDDE